MLNYFKAVIQSETNGGSLHLFSGQMLCRINIDLIHKRFCPQPYEMEASYSPSLKGESERSEQGDVHHSHA